LADEAMMPEITPVEPDPDNAGVGNLPWVKRKSSEFAEEHTHEKK
jgi:hypothetical protein